MSKLLAILALIAGILLPNAMAAIAEPGQGFAGDNASDNALDLRIRIAAVSLGELDNAALSALPGLPEAWASHPAVAGMPGEDLLSLSLVEKHLPDNTENRFVPYAGAWAEPLALDPRAMGLTPGDQDGARYAWNFGGGVIWFFRDVLGVDLGVRWTDRDYRLSRHGLRIRDVTTVANADIISQSVYIGLRMPLR